VFMFSADLHSINSAIAGKCSHTLSISWHHRGGAAQEKAWAAARQQNQKACCAGRYTLQSTSRCLGLALLKHANVVFFGATPDLRGLSCAP
jgi:hypothetical protein